MTDVVKYIIARWAYSVGQPIMSDAEYTILDRSMKACLSKDPCYQHSWPNDPCPVAMLKEYGYPQLTQAVVLSDKTESTPSLSSLIEVRIMYESTREPHSLSFKIDGRDIQASYYNGEFANVQTWGRLPDVMDAEAIAPGPPKTTPEMGRILVVMECSIPDSEFMWFKENLGSTSQRGVVSTALTNSEKCLSHVAIHAHGVRRSSAVTDKFALLKSRGFETPMYAWVCNFQKLTDQVKTFSDSKEAYDVPTDGLVVEGEATNALRIEVWEESIYRSLVTGYDETYGPHAVAVQYKTYPTKLSSSVQRRLPATNLSRIIDLDLRPGYPVAFRIASSSITDIDEESTCLVQKEYASREDMYRHMVQMNEVMKYQRYGEHI